MEAGGQANWTCLQSRRPSFLYVEWYVLEGWMGRVQPTLVIARWVAGRRGGTWNEDVGEWNRDASPEKSTLARAGHRIQGLEGSLAEKQSRRPSFLTVLQ